MAPYSHIANLLASKTFFTYRPLLILVGLEKEDVVNIANVHLVSFLGLFSLEKMPEKYKDFVHIFQEVQEKKPNKKDILDKNQANFTMFLKQRMEDLIRVCRQKARNIKGLPTEGFYYYYGPKKPPKNLNDLIKNYEKLGFRKLDSAVFKTIKRKNGVSDNSVFTVNDNYYIPVPIEKKSLTIDDFNGADMSPYDSLHNMNPEEAYFSLESDKTWERKQQEFNSKSLNTKANIIKNFIQKNKSDINFKEEIRAARKLLRDLE